MRLSTNMLASLGLIVFLQQLSGAGIGFGFGAAYAQSGGLGASSASSSSSSSSSNTAGSAGLGEAPEVRDSAAAVSVSRQGGGAHKAKIRKPKGDDFDGDRSLNMFQLEPSVINEKYYTSGQAEHHQKISPTLPYGAPIPDNEGPYAPLAQPQTQAPTSSIKPQTTGSADLKSDKLDSQLVDRLTSLEAIKNDSPALKLKLRVSTIDGDLVAPLKAFKVDVISSVPASGDMIVYAPARNVSDIGNLKEVLMVVLAQ